MGAARHVDHTGGAAAGATSALSEQPDSQTSPLALLHGAAAMSSVLEAIKLRHFSVLFFTTAFHELVA